MSGSTPADLAVTFRSLARRQREAHRRRRPGRVRRPARRARRATSRPPPPPSGRPPTPTRWRPRSSGAGRRVGRRHARHAARRGPRRRRCCCGRARPPAASEDEERLTRQLASGGSGGRGRPALRVVLDEVLDDRAVDGVDEHEPATRRADPRPSSTAPATSAGCAAPPDLLGRGVADREPDRLLGLDQRLLLVDVHPPTGREREDRDDGRAASGRPEPTLVDDRRGVLADDPHHEADGRDDQVDDRRDAPAGVVRELVRADVAGRVQIVGQLVAVVGRRRRVGARGPSSSPTQATEPERLPPDGAVTQPA